MATQSKNYISQLNMQAPLQLSMAMWLHSGQQDVSKVICETSQKCP